MSRRAEALPISFTAQERELIRHEMGIHFSQYPSLADGIFLRTWRGGPQKNQPKIPPAVRSMMDRGLVEIRTTERGRTPSSPRRGFRSFVGYCWTGAPWRRRVGAARARAGPARRSFPLPSAVPFCAGARLSIWPRRFGSEMCGIAGGADFANGVRVAGA
jgi:hypothetical protein